MCHKRCDFILPPVLQVSLKPQIAINPLTGLINNQYGENMLAVVNLSTNYQIIVLAMDEAV